MPRSAAPRRTANLTHSAVSVPVVFDLVSGRRTGADALGEISLRSCRPARSLSVSPAGSSSVPPQQCQSAGALSQQWESGDPLLRRAHASLHVLRACLSAGSGVRLTPEGGYPPGGLRRHSRLVRTWRCVARLKLNPKPYPSVPDSYHSCTIEGVSQRCLV